MAFCILHLDGDASYSATIQSLFESKAMDIVLNLVQSQRDFRRALEVGACDLILSEYSLPAYDGAAALKEARRRRPLIPVIVLSATPSEAAAAESLRSGAAGYLAKSDLRRLLPAVERALRLGGDRTGKSSQVNAADGADEANAAQAAMQASARIRHAGFKGLRILGAEDNKALTAFRGKEFDIVFMDCERGDIDIDIDIRILDRLRLLGGKESPTLFRELVRSFLETIPEKLAAIRELARVRGFRPLAAAAHGMKGLCLNFGALSMARECEALQAAAERERPGDLPRILERLAVFEAGTRTFLEGMIGAGAADAGSTTAASGGGKADG